MSFSTQASIFYPVGTHWNTSTARFESQFSDNEHHDVEQCCLFTTLDKKSFPKIQTSTFSVTSLLSDRQSGVVKHKSSDRKANELGEFSCLFMA